jgi:hypothetical protein
MAALTVALAAGAAASDTDCGNRDDLAKSPKLRILGLTPDQRLVQFKECSAARPRDIGRVSGLQSPDTALVGIDFRVQDGKLYGVGNGGGVYTINPANAKAVLVSKLTVALNGSRFGVDFNPAADRLRIVSDAGQNLRHNVNPGGVTISDASLNYTPGVTATGVAGAAYTNNDLDPATGTTLFDVDTVLNQVVIQSPPNNGVLVATGQLTVDAGSPVGFDIYTELRDGTASFNSGFAALVVGGVTGFYRINFLTGEAILIEEFDDPVTDIAIPLNQSN